MRQRLSRSWWRTALVALAAALALAAVVGAATGTSGGPGPAAAIGRHLASTGGPAGQASGAPYSPSASTGAGANTPSGATSGTAPAWPDGATGQSARIEEIGSVTLKVAGSQIDGDMGRLSALAAAEGGFVSARATQTESGATSGVVTLQVPQPVFETVLAQVQRVGTPSELTTKATDVTGQFVDLQARITALQDSRQQYLTIMTKATSIGDILSVQSQLDDLQAQLEQLQGQLQLLDGQTTYATLVVTLAPKAVPAATATPSGLSAAWHSALSSFVAGWEGVVRLAGPLLFLVLLFGSLGLAGRWAWQRRQAAPSTMTTVSSVST